MVVVMSTRATQEQVRNVEERLRELGFSPHVITGEERRVVAAVGSERLPDFSSLEMLPGVDKVLAISQPFKLVSRQAKPDDTIVTVRNARFGAGHFSVIAGPCAVESRDQIMESARKVKEAGASLLRGGAFKPRTSPYAFQGLGRQGLELLAEAGREVGLPIVSEVVDTQDVPLVAEYVDVLQIGTRNMQNYALLQAVGKAGKPVILKRGMSAKIEEWLMAAEYIASQGNGEIILCERGIRTYEPSTRNTLDIAAVPIVKELSHLPVIVDPSHGTGRSSLVAVMSKVAMTAGADGLIIEVHPAPENALSDGPQSLRPAEFAKLMDDIARLAPMFGRVLH